MRSSEPTSFVEEQSESDGLISPQQLNVSVKNRRKLHGLLSSLLYLLCPSKEISSPPSSVLWFLHDIMTSWVIEFRCGLRTLLCFCSRCITGGTVSVQSCLWGPEDVKLDSFERIKTNLTNLKDKNKSVKCSRNKSSKAVAVLSVSTNLGDFLFSTFTLSWSDSAVSPGFIIIYFVFCFVFSFNIL